MVALEHILIEPFEKLKEIERIGDPTVTFKPFYDYGTKKDLDRVIISKKKEKVKFYPVVWCLTPVTVQGRRPSGQVTLVLGILNDSYNMDNRQRNEQTVIYLQQLYKDIILRLDLCRKVKRINKDNDTTSTYYNYSLTAEGEQAYTIENWDAIKITFTLELTGCEC